MRLLRLPPVLGLTGTSRSSHYALIKNGMMTSSVPLGRHSVAWPEHEIMAINAARIAGKDDNEIRQLVTKLMDDRKTPT